MTKYRAIRNVKHRIAKAKRIVRRKGDDYADTSSKQFNETNRQKIKRQIKLEQASREH